MHLDKTVHLDTNLHPDNNAPTIDADRAPGSTPRTRIVRTTTGLAAMAAIAALALGAGSNAQAVLIGPTTVDPAHVPASRAPTGDGIDLAVTIGTDLGDGACGTDSSLDVTQLDQVNFCYRVTNNSDITLNYQTLEDDFVGSILSAVPLVLAPGATTQYNRIITARESQSPTSTWTAYDVHPGYAATDNNAAADNVFVDGFDGGATAQYAFIDITASGTNLMINDDDYVTDVDIGFPFSFYGDSSNLVTISNNGGMLFGPAPPGPSGRAGYIGPENRPLPDSELGGAILPFWDDLQQDYIDGIGNVFAETLGDAPNRRFVVEWFNLPVSFGGGSETVTFEAVMYEGSNQILFQYQDVICGTSDCNDGNSATIGVNAPSGVLATQVSYDQATVNAGKAILLTPTHPVAFSASQQSVLAVGVPEVAVDPPQFSETVNAGASTGDTLDIGNIGNRDLTWAIGSFGDTRSHFPPVSRFTLPMGDPSRTSDGVAPRAAASAKPHGKDVRRAPLRGGVPAFAINLDTSSFVGVDVADPSILSTIASVGDLILPGGAFVDEDFTKFYTIDYYTYDLLTIDTATGEVGFIGVAPLESGAGINWNGMSWDASTGTLYGVAFANSRDGVSSYLYKIDPVTAATTLVAQISGDIGDPDNGSVVTDIAVDTHGNMYGIELVGDDFIAIDKTTGDAAVISSLGFDANFSQGIDFDDYTGTLYYAAWDDSTAQAEMYTIDPVTGVLTLVAPISEDPANNQITGLAIARLSGVCAYPNEVPWLSYETTRGSTAPGDTSPVGVTFDASALAPGVYTANVCVINNDLTNRRVAVPVTLTVQ